MKKAFLYKTLLVGTGLALMGFYTNCSKIDVEDLPSTTVVSHAVTDLGNGEFTFDGSIQVGQKIHSDLDLIWVIDNSGSMETEIAHVRANLDQFTDSIGSSSNLKMALISQSGSGKLSFDLNVSNPDRFLQINQSVSSTNALHLAGSAFCTDGMGACSGYKATNAFGTLNTFLRPSSKKIFVIVTDDESQVSPESFTAAFNQTYPGQSFGLFGFIGLGAGQSPCQAKTGNRYLQLAKESGGQTYNICDRDWTSTFSTLAASVLSLVAPHVPLPHPMDQMEILSVSLNGQPLEPSDYQISSAGLLVDMRLLEPNRSYQVSIRYVMK